MSGQHPSQRGAPLLMLAGAGLIVVCGPTGWGAEARLAGAGIGSEERTDVTKGSRVPRVDVRVGDHGDFERIVFAWPAAIDCNVVQSAEQVTVTFSQRGSIDVAGIADRLRSVVDASAEDDDTARVTLRLSPRARVRWFNLQDGRVGIDVFGTATPNLLSPAPDSEPNTVEELRRALEQRDAVIDQRDAVIDQLRSRLDQLTARFERLEQALALSSGDLERVTAGQAGPMASVGVTPRPPARPPSVAPDGALGVQSSGEAPATRSQAATPERQSAITGQGQGPEDTGAPTRQQTTQTEAPAPGQVEVDEEAVERALDFTLVQQGALLLPVGRAEFTPSFTYTRRTTDFPVVLGPAGNQVIAEQEVRRNEFEFAAGLLLGLPFDSQLELGLPYDLVDQSAANQVLGTEVEESSETGHGLGDFSVGLAKTVLRERNWLPDVVLRVNWDTGAGESQDNDVVLDGGFQELTGSISLTKRQDPLVFVGGAFYEAAFEHNDIDPGDTLGFSIGTFLAASPNTSLRVVLNQNFIDEFKVDGERINGSDQVQSILSFGASAILGRNMLLDGAVGVGLTDDSPDYSVSISLPIRFSTPGL